MEELRAGLSSSTDEVSQELLQSCVVKLQSFVFVELQRHMESFHVALQEEAWPGERACEPLLVMQELLRSWMLENKSRSRTQKLYV